MVKGCSQWKNLPTENVIKKYIYYLPVKTPSIPALMLLWSACQFKCQFKWHGTTEANDWPQWSYAITAHHHFWTMPLLCFHCILQLTYTSDGEGTVPDVGKEVQHPASAVNVLQRNKVTKHNRMMIILHSPDRQEAELPKLFAIRLFEFKHTGTICSLCQSGSHILWRVQYDISGTGQVDSEGYII